MDEELYPVCSPALRDTLQLRTPGDLARQTLIHDLSVSPDVGFATWEGWMQQAVATISTTPRGLRINSL